MTERTVTNKKKRNLKNYLRKLVLKKNKFINNNKLKDELESVNAKLDYYYYEISDLRSKLRYLLADSQAAIPYLNQTYSSFNFQWDSLKEGKNLLSDESFVYNITNLISEYTTLPTDWFKDKKVLDAGCGQGRFSYGFMQLNSVLTAFDQSENAVNCTKTIAQELNKNATVFQHNLLKPLTLESDYDLVWSFGVIHHTGNTYTAFKNISKLVKPGGYLFLMVYGEPPIDNVMSFKEQTSYSRMRYLTRNMNFEEKINFLKNEVEEPYVHGWFDAISPLINDTYSIEELKNWLIADGFGEIEVTSCSTNHHIIAKRISAP